MTPPVLRVLTAMVSALALAASAAAHPGESHVAAEAVATYEWTWDPWSLPFLVASAALYAAGAWRLRQSSPGRRALPVWAAAAFASGWLVAALALLSPIDSLSDTWFSVHMSQHMLLMLIAAPLMVIGRPLATGLWGLPEATRRRIGGGLSGAPMGPTWRTLTSPWVAWALHALVLWVWHAPVLYDAVLRDQGIHALQHLSFFAASVVFWWSLVQGRHGRLGYGSAVVYVFTTAVHGSLLGALITVSPTAWYPTYVARQPAAAIEDQQLAGLLMWIPAGVVLLVIALALFAAWLGEASRRGAMFDAGASGPRP